MKLLDSFSCSALMTLLIFARACTVYSQENPTSADDATREVTSEAPALESELRMSVAERFRSLEAISETPDFQRHVVPLMGKLGCNGRACHGSFQGRGGFRLSLFGYDFQTDHDELHGRLDPTAPAESLILQKPLMQIQHEGGRRLDEGSWEHHLILKWVEAQAPARSTNPDRLIRLELSPPEVVANNEGEQQQLRAIAVWSDGSSEDVTALCRFQSNDEQVATISQDGLVTVGSAGDTHIVAFYDSAVIPVPVMRPVSPMNGESYPEVQTPSRIDELVVGKLKKLGIVQSEVCSDEDFLRRVSLDVTGTLPTPNEVKTFLADTDSDKRTRKIDELLERPGYAAWWTTRLCDFTGNSDDQLNNVTPVRAEASRQWYDWIEKRVASNTPYDDIVEGIVMAVSRNPGESYEEYCQNLSTLYHQGSGVRFADRTYMPHYWSRQNFQTSEDRVIGFAYTFLGSRIQCAQCHKHPFDQWTQEDFQKFEGFFKGTQGRGNNPHPTAKKEYDQMLAGLEGTEGLKGNQLLNQFQKLLKEGKTVPFGEVYALTPSKGARADKSAEKSQENPRRNRSPVPTTARLLGGHDIDLTQYDDIRRPLMDWLRSPDNPLFAKAFVNRVWANYFHRGIVNPSDDLNLANPPVNAELLDYLAKGFVEHEFDMKWLHREILNSRTYQLTWVPNETNQHDTRNFSRAVPRRIPAEVAWDIVTQSLANTSKNEELITSVKDRAIHISGSGTRNRGRSPADYAMTVFGRSVRESNCDCDRSEEPSLLQTIFVRNDGQVLQLIDDKNGWLAEVAARYGLTFRPMAPTESDRGSEQRARAAKKRSEEQLAALRKRLNAAQEAGNKTQVEQLKDQIKKLREKAAADGIAMMEEGVAMMEDGVAKMEMESDSGSDTAVDAVVAVTTISGAAAVEKVSLPDGWNSEELVREAYLRTLSRSPRPEELATATQFIAEANNPVDGLRSVLWALVNTKEFIVNH
ncbi:MAG: DUF1549 domain-containing protein [Planctomyces sp.]|nr:DUF1549 domain-containing protein [Planctomyces sp.]